MALPFRLAIGHTVALRDEYGRKTSFYVRAVRSDGWMLEPYDREGERVFHSAPSIERVYLAGLFEYMPWDNDTIPEGRRRRLQEEFEAQPEQARRKAQRKLKFVKAAEALMRAGSPKGRALIEAIAAVIVEHGETWHREDVGVAREAFKRRELLGLLEVGEYFKEPPPHKAPVERTLWEWIARFVQSGRSINGLLDNNAEKGRRQSQLSDGQDEALSNFIRDHVTPRGGFKPAAAYSNFEKFLETNGLPSISRKTFRLRVGREFDRKGMAGLLLGVKAARRTGTVSGSGPTPLHPLNQVEADHALLNVRLVDDSTGIDLGRPWISAIRDRMTKAMVGVHNSFLSPSWATLSRAIGHAMWPKDLSGHPGLVNTWDAHGVFDECYTDRGMDFLSASGRWSSLQMRFEILNLPGFSPWLKGGLERWNRDIKAEIMTFRDGITSFENPEYRGRNLPTIKLSEFNAMILRWIVDDHHQHPHGGLGGRTPHEVYVEGIDRFGPTRPVADFARFSRMMMTPKRRTIQNDGVEVSGFFYTCEHLSELRRRNDAPADYQILVHPWDTGYIELLAGKTWHVLINKCAGLAGVSAYRTEVYWEHAKRENPGRTLTLGDFMLARQAVDDDAGRVLAMGLAGTKLGTQNMLGRFNDVGEFLTPVPMRPVAFPPPPIEVPGWVERGGVLHPAGHPPFTGASSPSSKTIPGPAASAADANVTPLVRTGEIAPKVTSSGRLADLAAAAAARSLELRS